MDRRELLTLGGVSLMGCFAGCHGGLGGLGGDGRQPSDEQTSSEEATSEESIGENSSRATNETVTESTGPEGSGTRNTNRGSDAESTTESEEFAVVASYPAETANGTEYERRTVFTREDFVDVGDIREVRGSQQASIPVTPSDEAAERFVDVMNENGFTDEGVGSCRWREDPDDPGWCLYTVVDGEITYAAAMGNGLAAAIRSGEYLQNPSFLLQASSRSEAEELRERLKNDAE